MSVFDWNNIANNLQENALSDGKTYQNENDERFWNLSRDENDTGGALIRFLIDPNQIPFIKMIRINANGGYNKRFVREWSPLSIGLPDPFNEMFSKLWNEGKKEEAKKFGRQIRYITNIKVIKDPANPENEGKIFLFNMSQTLFDKIKSAMVQTESMKALGEEPIQVYNPVEGNNFLIKVKKGSNGILTYEDSKFDSKITGIYKTEEEALKDIKENCYSLEEFLTPEFFLTYEELQDKIKWFMGETVRKDRETQETTETTKTTETAEEMETSETTETPKSTKSTKKSTETSKPKKEETQKVEETSSEDSEIEELLEDL